MKDSRKFLLHIKALVWCLHRLCQKYDCEKIIASLKDGKVHPEILTTNLGENVEYILSNIESKNDVTELINSLRDISKEKIDMREVPGSADEVGYYIKSKEKIGDIPANTFGIVTCEKKNNLEILFYIEGKGLVKKFAPASKISVISGTYPD